MIEALITNYPALAPQRKSEEREQLVLFERPVREYSASYLTVLTATTQVLYLNRSDAEQDRRYKQLIPYVLILCRDKILRYRRGKGGQETRLHGLYSVGIGGHISEEDHGD